MRILLVEDEPRLAAFIQGALAGEGYAVDVACTGEQGVACVNLTTYDLVVLDIMLPGIDGFAVCREVRQRSIALPVLMLSARGVVEDRVRGLDAGADDYLTKPFVFAELSARVRALLRRHRTIPGLTLVVGNLVLDPLARIVKRGERRIDLTSREFALLEFLMRHADQAVSRAMIAERVWDFTWDRLTNVIDVYVNHLRRKSEGPGESRLIHAVRGVGYVIRDPGAAN